MSRLSGVQARSRGVVPEAGFLAGCLALMAWLPPAAWGEGGAGKLRVAEDLVREALSHELYGMSDQRERLLEQALAAFPSCAAARWQLGQLRTGDQWTSVEEYRQTPGQQKVREQYERRRAEALDTVEAQLSLADWCADRKLPLQEQAHLNRVIQLQPDHAGARARLNQERIGRRWVDRQDLWQGMKNTEAMAASLKKWQSRLERLARSLDGREGAIASAAIARLQAELTPDAIPAIETVLGAGGERSARLAVALLTTLPQADASQALARLAVLSAWPDVRYEAAKELSGRPRDHYVPLLLAELSTPIESRIRTALINGRILYRHAVTRETQDSQQVQVADTAFDRRPSLVLTPGGTGLQAVDPFGAALAIENAQSDAQARALSDLQQMIVTRELERRRQNLLIHQLNERICRALQEATGEDLAPSAEAWWNWWDEENGVLVAEKAPDVQYAAALRVYVDQEPLYGGPDSGASGPPSSPPSARCECFVAGTPVWTAAGIVEIEKIRVGDLVLSQHPETGELAYKPVLQTTWRSAEPLFKVSLGTRGRETLEGSGGHPLWVAGEGWTLLRKLRSGMVLHRIGGSCVVSCLEEGSVQPTYNLVVADFHTYVVSEAKILCHDNTPRRPSDALVPGLIQR